ncbi:Intracellular proteinase inhibitor [Chthonomonas calidirosea]|nr:BsuPI-related putative proteinase inhibitor [Chthonomonas calidirosea]CEK14448.1 Intracellular proteinase inhibitor [Chthonomonas calidirosea]
MRFWQKIFGISLFVLFGFVGSCTLGFAQGDGNETPMPMPSNPLKLTLKLDKQTYSPDEPIVVQFRVTNVSKTSQRLAFATTQHYDFEIHAGDVKGPVIWRWSKGRLFGQVVLQQTLAPGQEILYKETIYPQDAKHPEGIPPLKPGKYTLLAILTTMPRTARPSVSCTFEVK